MAVLFGRVVSEVVVVHDVVFVIDGLGYVSGTWKVEVIVADCPTFRMPRLHGKALVQAPEFETNVRPAGVVSATTTPFATSGPAFVTKIVYTMSWPRAMDVGPVLVIDRSACEMAGVTVVVMLEVLLDGCG